MFTDSMLVRAVVKLAEQSEKVVGLMEQIADTQGVILQELKDLKNQNTKKEREVGPAYGGHC